jgi:hypothetical protein
MLGKKKSTPDGGKMCLIVATTNNQTVPADAGSVRGAPRNGTETDRLALPADVWLVGACACVRERSPSFWRDCKERTRSVVVGGARTPRAV